MKNPVSHLRAIGFALASYTVWVVTDACMKLAGEAGVPPHELMGLMGLSGVTLVTLGAIAQGNAKKLRLSNARPQLFCGLCSVACMLSNAIALRHLSLTLFYIVVFTAPMIIAVMAAFSLHEKLSPGKIIAIIVGFTGVVIAINPFGGTNEADWIGYVAGTASVLSYALWTICVRSMAQALALESIALFSGASLITAGLLWTLFDFHPLGLLGLAIALIAGALNLGGNLLNYKALKHTTAANVAQIHYTQIITGSMLGYFVWHDRLTWRLVAGAVVIIASGLYIAARARKTENIAAVSLSTQPPV